MAGAAILHLPNGGSVTPPEPTEYLEPMSGDEVLSDPLQPIVKTVTGEALKAMVYPERKPTYHVMDTFKVRFHTRFGGKIGSSTIACPRIITRAKHSSVVVIDIDNQTPEEAEALIQLELAGKLFVGKSPSGNVKGFFTVVHPFCVLSREVAIETIRQHLGDAIADRCDPQGLFATYLTPSIKEAMNLAKGIVVETAKVKHHHKMYRANLDRKVVWRVKEKAGSAADLAILMLSWSKRGNAGNLHVPLEYWAEELGCSLSTVHRKMKKLMELGMIEKVSDGYKVGSHAKSFAFKGLLLFFGKLLREKPSLSKSSSQDNYLVSAPESRLGAPSAGGWHSWLWKATNFFKSGVQFIKFVESLPGSNKKDRLQQAKFTWNHHAKRNALATI